MKKAILVNILLIIFTQHVFSQIIRTNRDSLYFFHPSDQETLMVCNIGDQPLIIDSLSSASNFYGYFFVVYVDTNTIYNYFAGNFFYEPYQLVIIQPNDTACFVFHDIDLCPVCKKSFHNISLSYFTDTLYFYNNSINDDTLSIFTYGEGWDSGIQEYGDLLIRGYLLFPNYPNPFNSTTIISYYVPLESDVTITIFDILGRKVSILKSGIHQKGNYQLIWESIDIPSGLYFILMSSGIHLSVRKCIVLK